MATNAIVAGDISSIPMKEYPAGVYILRMEWNGKIGYRKIVKQ
jgi:hypothetical protein